MLPDKKETRDTYKKLSEPNCNEKEVSRWTRWRKKKSLQKFKNVEGILFEYSKTTIF